MRVNIPSCSALFSILRLPGVASCSELENPSDNLSMILASGGEVVVVGGCCQAPVSLAPRLSLKALDPPTHPPHTPLHSLPLPPASLVIQISLLSAHISEAPQFACQLA